MKRQITSTCLKVISCLLIGIGISSFSANSYANFPQPEDKRVFNCPKHADFVVTDETEFNDALSNASPGDTIALDGAIPITVFTEITTENLTISCKNPGSGFVIQDNLRVSANGITIENLQIDGTQTSQAIQSIGSDNATIRHNDMLCGPSSCVFVSSSENMMVEDNHFTYPSNITPSSCLHFQFGVSGLRVINNRITLFQPSTVSIFGGIRVYNSPDTKDVIIKNNVIIGPWQNGIAIGSPSFGTINRKLTHSIIKHNVMRGFIHEGIQIYGDIRKNLILKNTIDGGENGIVMGTESCANKIMANNISNFSMYRAVFDTETGNNFYSGDPNLVTDFGAFDCTGDNINDPNFINS